MDYNILATVAQPMITSFLDSLLKPKILEIQKKSKQKFDDTQVIDSFSKYIKRSYESYKYMNTIVFRNNPIKIYELYCPLTLVRGDEKFLIDSYPKKILDYYKKIVITDDAGMGKSTLLKWIFVNVVHSELHIPVFIELRKLSKEKNIIEELFKELNNLNTVISREHIYDMVESGKFIFLLDGYDEIPQEFIKEVTEELQYFISRSRNNTFILTSRPHSAISSFNDFNEFKIKPLDKEEAFNLIKKYDIGKTFSKPLINIISQQNEMANLHEFLSNPLMVSLLYKGYEYKQTIPYKKSLFYRQVFDALFEDHDLIKGGAFVHEKLSLLDSENFHTVLRSLGFITFKLGKIEYSKDELMECLRDAKNITSINFEINNFLKDIIFSVPLFYKEGLFYRWKHKSLQEYFAAQFICVDSKGQQQNLMMKLYNNPNFDNYLNLLDLCYDMDTKTFNKTIIYELLKEIEKYFLENNKNDTYIPEDIKGMFFWVKHYIVPLKNLKYDSDDKIYDRKSFIDYAIKQHERILPVSQIEEKKYSQITISQFNNLNFFSVIYIKNQFKLIDLLYKKGIDIFDNNSEYQLTLKKLSNEENIRFRENYYAINSFIENDFKKMYEIIDYDFFSRNLLSENLAHLFAHHFFENRKLLMIDEETYHNISIKKVVQLKEKIEFEIAQEKAMSDIYDF